MSVSQCQVADWGRVGRADGAKGESESHLADYQKDCGKAGVTPNAQAYRQGWDVGIQSFCTATVGWREGVQGHSGKAEVCRGQRGHAAFSRNLENGLQVHRTSERIRQNTTETTGCKGAWKSHRSATRKSAACATTCAASTVIKTACVICWSNNAGWRRNL